MKDEFLDYVEDIIKAMDDAISFVKGMNYDVFVNDRKTVYAVIRALEIIGEERKIFPLQLRFVILKFLGKTWLECGTR